MKSPIRKVPCQPVLWDWPLGPRVRAGLPAQAEMALLLTVAGAQSWKFDSHCNHPGPALGDPNLIGLGWALGSQKASKAPQVILTSPRALDLPPLTETDQKPDRKFRWDLTRVPATAGGSEDKKEFPWTACLFLRRGGWAGSLYGERVGVSRGQAGGVAWVVCRLLRRCWV